MRRTAAAAVAALLLLAAGCGDDDAETSTGTSDTTATTVEDTSSTTPTSAGGTTDTTAAGELPGERIEIFPYEDAPLAVVGVAADDTLNLRAAPSVDGAVVDELAPLADGLTATGHNRQLDDGSIWAEVDTGDTTGWANTAYLAQVGSTDDVTAALYPDTADLPRAETLVDLADAVARQAAGEGPPEPRVVVVVAPSVGDLGEITVDVLDYPDDAVLGQRLHLFAEEEGGDSFRLRTVEATTLCRRGVSDGACA